MKRILIVLAVIILVAAVAFWLFLQHVKGNILDGPGMVYERPDSVAVSDDTLATTVAEASDIRLPELMMPGPLDPIPWEEGGEYFVLVVANLGPFASLSQLHDSPFYPQLCSLYPELPEITDIIDTGKGDLWLMTPWTENTSLALTEYNIDMFLGEQDPGSGTIYLRTENARPLLVRMTTDDPGSVLVNAVANDGHQLSWTPASQPADNVLREERGVENITFNPVDNCAEFGTDYEARIDGETVSLRFYADRQMWLNTQPKPLNNQPMRYYATITTDNRIALLITTGDGRQCLAYIDGYAPDQGFTLTVEQGADIGFPLGRSVQFKPQGG